MKLKKRTCGGFSLAEVVVALAVIVIVSVTSFSILHTSIAAKSEALNKAYAQSFADNLWECFKASDTQEEFCNAVYFAEGVRIDSWEDNSADAEGTTITYHTRGYRAGALFVSVAVKFSDEEADTLEVTITDKDEKEIISFSYQKEEVLTP